MSRKTVISGVQRGFGGIANRLRGNIPMAKLAIRKPAVAGYILLTAYKAHICLAGAVLLLTLVIAPLVDAGLDRIFPPKTSKKLFGLVKEQKHRPLRNRLDRMLMTSFWMLSLGAVGYLVWIRIPSGVAEAGRYSRLKESEADDVYPSDPRRAARLYRRAALFTVDPEHEEQLVQKMNRQIAADEPKPTRIIPAGETLIEISNREALGNRQPGLDAIGVSGRYLLEEELGTGGMGTVYRGLDTVLDRRIAVKKLSDRFMGDDEYLSRFQREAKALAKLAHPAIVQVYDLIEDKGSLWMALEYVDGGDLADYLRKKNQISLNESAVMIRAIAAGLAYAHDQGIIHRDLKPSNILLTNNREPKISDFGLARLACSSVLTQEGAILGSPRYMSPEQAAGNESDERSDMYALGVTFYELLAGRPPFDGDTARVLAQHITQPPPPLREIPIDVPHDIEELIMRMLAKNPDDRPGGMSRVVESLDHLRPISNATSPRP